MPDITYVDFDLLILPQPSGFQARVLNSPAGEASVDFQQPFSEQELEVFQAGIARGSRHLRLEDSESNGSDLESIKKLGGRLFKTVFQGNVLQCFQNSLREVQRQNAGLRLRLRLNDVPALAKIPWEYLYQPDLNRFLVASNKTPLVRYLELPETITPITVTAPLRLLVMISDPQRPLDVESEWQKLRQSLSGLEERGLVKLDRIVASLEELQVALRQQEYHVFHFIGHGGFDARAQDGVLLFETQDACLEVTGERLGALLHDHALRLVVLNACEGAQGSSSNPFAGVAQNLVQQGVGAVIAMQHKITDLAAIAFSYSFYQAIADGYPIDAALGEARKALFAKGDNLEWGIPVLHMRASDAHLFRVETPNLESNQLVRVRDYFAQKAHTVPSSEAQPSNAMAPQLIAREPQWQALEQAWSTGQAALIVGEHGTGKTRLVQDFANAKGPHLMVRALPLEAKDPNSTLTRILYELLQRYPDLEVEHWVIQELARIMPEFGNAPNAAKTENDRERFLRAIDRLFETILSTTPMLMPH